MQKLYPVILCAAALTLIGCASKPKEDWLAYAPNLVPKQTAEAK